MCKTPWQSLPSNFPQLKKDTIHVWRVSLDSFNSHLNSSRVTHFLGNSLSDSVLSSDEKERAAKFKFPEHQQRFIISRSMLRHILGYYLNQSPSTLIFQSSHYGKPYLVDRTVYFNLSHAGQYILYAIGLQQEIGIDIEEIRQDIKLQDIAERFFSVYENQFLYQLAENQKVEAFFRIWTCKEAFIKAVGKGLSFPLKEFDIDITQDQLRLVGIRHTNESTDVVVENSLKWSLIPIAAPNNYVATLAIRENVTTIKSYNF